VIVTDHSSYDYDWIVKQADLVVDTRNATRNVKTQRHKIVKA
jgi:UDP-N-acetyl-D-glucosamine dehydrogenase